MPSSSAKGNTLQSAQVKVTLKVSSDVENNNLGLTWFDIL